MEALPYDITEAMVQCFGKCFHYKDGVASFMLAAGIERAIIDKYRDEPKFVWARRVLADLAPTDAGRLMQRRLLSQLCNLRNVADTAVPDPDGALNALRHLKDLALQRDLIVRKQQKQEGDRARVAAERERIVKERAEKLAHLHRVFLQGLTEEDRQQAGYSLEALLVELFSLFEIEYQKSYRTPTQQIDGQFTFEGFHYLVEARWRKEMPTEQEIGGFKHKVDGKLESTRGLFVSVPGFRAEVVQQFNSRGSNIILIDGGHLIQVLEGRMDVRDLLKLVIDRAAREGIVFTPLAATAGPGTQT